MGRAKGVDTRLGIALETTYGAIASGLGANKKLVIVPYVSETIAETQAMIESKSIKSSRNANKPARGNINVTGDIKFELNPLMYAVLAHMMGSRVTVDSFGAPHTIAENAAAVADETAPYITTFKTGALPLSFTIEKKFVGLTTPKYYQFSGCRVNKFDFDIKSDGLIDCGIVIGGSKLTVGSDSISKNGGDQNGYDLDLEHRPLESFEMLAADLKIGGVAVAYVNSLKFTVENNLDEKSYIVGGLGRRTSLPEGMVKIIGTVEALFGDDAGADSVALINAIIGGTPSSIDMTFTRGTGAGTAGNEKLQIVLPELIFTRGSPIVSGPTGVMVALPFTVYYDTNGDSTTAKIIMTQSNPIRI